MALSPKEVLMVGRAILKSDNRAPYLAAVLDALVPHEMPGLGTVGVTDNGILLWDPERVGTWTPDETSVVLEHECWHVLRKHGERCKAACFDQRLFNIAGDCEINDDLEAAGLKLPKFSNPDNPQKPGEPVTPKTFGFEPNKIAEEYYAKLRQMAKEQMAQMLQELGIENPAGGDGDEQGEGDGEGQPQEKEGRDGKGGGNQPKVGRGWCGSGAGRALPQEPKGKEAEGLGRTPGEMARMRVEVAEAIKQKAQRGRGNMPNHALRWADETLKPPVIPWQQKLARAARQAIAFRPGCQDYHYSKPSRRQAAVGHGFGHPVLPAMREPVPYVLICVDTSGSMGSDELNTALSETAGILKATTANVDFLSVDCDITTLPKPARSWQDAAKLLHGGGGTDFRVPFQLLRTLKKQPDVLIYITDGCGPCPISPPDKVNTIWVLVGPHQQLPYMCPESDKAGYGGRENKPLDWGTVISIPAKGQEKEAA